MICQEMVFLNVHHVSVVEIESKLDVTDLTLILVSGEEELLIERSIHTGTINPADPWQTIRHDGPVARLIYRIRVRCDEHYYSNKCNKLCVPRDDYFGHYRCEPSGAQVCLDGWMGPDCRTGELPTPRKMVPTVI